jgi:two-component system, cell cycle sensor histidine kinase and response regulator CckA
MNRKCILVAEDDPATLGLTVSSLKPEGYHLLEAGDGLEALSLSEQHPGAIDLLITDLNMPRMTGHELARTIKEARPDIRILIMSGIRENNFPPEAVHHSDALLKPVRPERLVSKVNELLAVRVFRR